MLRLQSQAEDIEMSRRIHTKTIFSEISKSQMSEMNIYTADPKQEAFEKVFFLASMCLKFEKYEDALRYVDEMVKLKETELLEDEREVFIQVYKCYISEKRSAWRSIYILESQEKTTKLMMNEVKLQYEESIIKTCEKLIGLINNYIMSKTKSIDGICVFLKFKADHYRYMAEITKGQILFNNKQNAFLFYRQAYERSAKLDDIDSVKLGIALNYSVFLYEILNKRINSIFYAKEALNKSLIKLKEFSDDELANDVLRESLSIIKIMNDNVHQWYQEELRQAEIGREELNKLEK